MLRMISNTYCAHHALWIHNISLKYIHRSMSSTMLQFQGVTKKVLWGLQSWEKKTGSETLQKHLEKRHVSLLFLQGLNLRSWKLCLRALSSWSRWERERDRYSERDTERERDGQRERQTERERDRQRERQTEIETDRQRGRETKTKTARERERGRETERGRKGKRGKEDRRKI